MIILHQTTVTTRSLTYYEGDNVWELWDLPDISEEELFMNIQEQLL